MSGYYLGGVLIGTYFTMVGVSYQLLRPKFNSSATPDLDSFALSAAWPAILPIILGMQLPKLFKRECKQLPKAKVINE